MEKTSPQGKQQAMNSTSEKEEEMCDKAGDNSLDGIVYSSAASFKAKSVGGIGDHDHCNGMFFNMCFGNETLHPFPTFFNGDTLLHDFVQKRSWSSLAQHIPVKLISPTDFADGCQCNLDDMIINRHEDAKFIHAKQT